jgi:hypothetical protein
MRAAVHSHAEEIHLTSENGVITVEHSVLSLDAETSSVVNFVSSPGPAFLFGKLAGKQVLLPDEAYRILAPRFPSTPFLPCPFFRTISLGNLNIELLPSGEGTGSSFLYLQKDKDSLLYAGCWSRTGSLALRKAQPKQAETLFLRLQQNPLSLPQGSVRKETERFIEFAQKILKAQENVVVAVGSFGEAQFLASRLFAAQVPVSCDAKLHRVFKTLEESLPPSEVPRWLKAANRLPQNAAVRQQIPSVILLSRELLLSQKPRMLPQGVWVWLGVEPLVGYRQPWLSSLTFVDTFTISLRPDAPEVLALIADVKPSQVLVTGDGATLVVQWLAGRGIPAELFAPPRLQTLF